MTNSSGNRVSLSSGDWVKVLGFLLLQTTALIGVGIDMRERLVVVETRLKVRDDNIADLRGELADLRRELIALRTK